MTYTFDEQIVSDLYKDAHGFRPREYFWSEWNNSTDDQKQELWDGLINDLEYSIEEEKRIRAEAVDQFEAQVEYCLEMGATSRENAIRWIIESLQFDEVDLMYGGSRICYELGLPYSMEDMFTRIMLDIKPTNGDY
jgi:hypothetical protein